MKNTPNNDFYADQLTYQFQRQTKRFRNFCWMVCAVIFVMAFIALIFRAKQTNEYLNYLTDFFLDNSNSLLYRILWSLPFWLLIIVLPTLPMVIFLVRKFLIYPKNTFTNRSTGTIQSKETLFHRRGLRTFLVTVNHPFNQKPIIVEIDENEYEKLQPGDTVYLKYHPTKSNVLYLESYFNRDDPN